jgi:hypothetical protein
MIEQVLKVFLFSAKWFFPAGIKHFAAKNPLFSPQMLKAH